jgi:hypothetical protein
MYLYSVIREIHLPINMSGIMKSKILLFIASCIFSCNSKPQGLENSQYRQCAWENFAHANNLQMRIQNAVRVFRFSSNKSWITLHNLLKKRVGTHSIPCVYCNPIILLQNEEEYWNHHSEHRIQNRLTPREYKAAVILHNLRSGTILSKKLLTCLYQRKNKRT